MKVERIEWLPSEEAAQLLKLSKRRVLELASEGRLRSKRERDPQKKQNVVRIHAGDVERYLNEANQPKEPEARLPAPLRQATRFAAVAHLLQAQQTPAPVASKPWISVEQAAEDSGLPLNVVRYLLRQGALPSLGRGADRRIHRADLDALRAPARELANSAVS